MGYRDYPAYPANAGENLEAYRLVKLNSSGEYVYCDAGETPTGVIRSYTASGDPVSADLIANWPGTLEIMASKSISYLAPVYTANDGKITDANTGCKVGIALAAATADGDIIENLPCGAAFPASTVSATSLAIPLESFRKNTLLELGTAGDGTNLGLVAGTHGSASPTLQGSDAGGTTVTETVRLSLPIPADYASGDITLRLHAGMLTTVADTTATLDVQAFEPDGEAGIGSDICETDAASIKSLTLADKDFTLSGDNLSAGDELDIELTSVVTDSGDLGVMKAVIGSAKILYNRTVL